MEKPKRLKYSDLHDMYNADEMDTYLAQKDKEISELAPRVGKAGDPKPRGTGRDRGGKGLGRGRR